MPSERSVSGLTDHLGYWLRLVSNQVSISFARKLERRGVTVAEWVVLRELYDAETLAPSRLAERMGMTRGAISKLADRLLAKALVEKTESAEDRRAHALGLSVAGRRLVPELAALADENDAAFFAPLTPAERASLDAALRKIARERGLQQVPVS